MRRLPRGVRYRPQLAERVAEGGPGDALLALRRQLLRRLPAQRTGNAAAAAASGRQLRLVLQRVELEREEVL